MSPSPSEQLCLACGLCCDGTLFTHVSLTPTEAEAMAQHGLPVGRRADGTQALPQRCGALSGRCCTAYAARPAGCRRYRCLLLMALEEGEVGLGEAQALVAEAQARVEAVGAALPAGGAGDSTAVLQRARAAAQSGPPLSGEAQAAWQRAEDFLDAHFRGRAGSRR